MSIIYMDAMLQKVPVNNFEWIKETSQFNDDFLQSYNEESYDPEKLHELQNDLPFLPERIKTEKVEKLVAKLCNKTEYVIHIKNLKQALNHRLVLKKGPKVIKFNHSFLAKTIY